jgi:hypothetical protein
MKRLTLHRIASSLLRFIAPSAQLWVGVQIGDQQEDSLLFEEGEEFWVQKANA